MPELSPWRHLAAIWDDFGRLSAIEGSIFIDLITNVFDGTDFELVGGTRPAAFTILPADSDPNPQSSKFCRAFN